MKSILIDTHVFLWLQTTPERLAPALHLLTDQDTTVLFSAASSWEIVVKWGIGRLSLPERPDHYVPDRTQRDDITALPVLHSHALCSHPRTTAIPSIAS